MTEYYEHLEEYFSLKEKYEKKYNTRVRSISKLPYLSIKEKQKRVKRIKMKCIGCARTVGTIFSNDDNTYSAVCGDRKNPCSLDISLKRGIYIHIPTEIAQIKQFITENETDIIYEKLDLLFGFINEDQMIPTFEELKEEHKTYSQSMDTYKEVYNQLLNTKYRDTEIKTHTISKYEFIQKYKTKISEYLTTNDEQLLSDTIEEYIGELMPILKNIANYKYMERTVEKDPETGICILIQKPQILQYEGIDIEPPSIQAWKFPK